MEGQQLKPIAILGAGSWGTALALYLARRGQTVRIWSIEESEITAMITDKANNRYMPGFSLPDQIHPMTNLEEAVSGVEDVIVVVPSAGFRHTLAMLKPLIGPHVRITCAAKGLDTDTGQLLGEVAEEIFTRQRPFAVLSGPSFAREVAAGLPCAVVIASHHKPLLADMMQRFNSPIFRIYTSDDVTGVEVGGATKNVIAIATGISDGMELGSNARSALITRGLAEIIRLGTALGGKLETFVGLSGLGDLILTCSDNQSRNRRLGLALGKGRDLLEAEKEIGQVVEGKRNAELIAKLAKRHGIDMPICETVWQILQNKLSAKDAISILLARSAKSELLSS
ncbi:Glycerol-3-phosphate dehydrogenase [NAD(P)+] [Aquicella siphonis]|uniref:Glycerol-3-phosphate dehydrogenase [NAD(P)+] n=1 Tax=Aquicella siphonis TaxID=254247 RepID=A0A5E4PFK1_9COXI|nr:NAD(P)H-dependent glycerol-3-phosphate dehydrogenase [Aquicella siphonis]VVC75106.1 Glycerol-3-phosphate dehydrogenase [NAD(P)+] [Aquicella siphonis]